MVHLVEQTPPATEHCTDVVCSVFASDLPAAILAAAAVSLSMVSILPSFSNDCFAAAKANCCLSWANAETANSAMIVASLMIVFIFCVRVGR